MRKITDHIVEGDTAPQLEIQVLDEPGAGGANHKYLVKWEEALLAIVIDRLRSFQAGPFPSPFNATALVRCQDALRLLQQRTRDRIARGVEGKTAV